MATLTAGQRSALGAQYQEELSSRREQLPLTKADLAAAITAIDNWVESNATSFNTAIPQPVRGALTARQKMELFMRVTRARFEVG